MYQAHRNRASLPATVTPLPVAQPAAAQPVAGDQHQHQEQGSLPVAVVTAPARNGTTKNVNSILIN